MGWFFNRTMLLMVSIFSVSSIFAINIKIPDGVEKLRGLYLTVGTTSSMDFSEACKAWDFAWVDENLGMPQSSNGAIRSPDAGTRQKILDNLKKLGEQTGHPEIENLPFIAAGESRTAAYAAHLATLFPERTIAVAGVALGIGGVEVPKYIPRIAIIGSGDNAHGTWFEKLSRWFLPSREAGALITGAVMRGRQHGYYHANDLLWPFFDQVIHDRLPLDWDPSSGPPNLRNYRESAGWLGDFYNMNSATPHIAPYSQYQGDKSQACWFPNRSVAFTWRALVATPEKTSILEPAVQWSKNQGLGYGDGWFAHDQELNFHGITSQQSSQIKFFFNDRLTGEITGSGNIKAPIPVTGIHSVHAESFLNGERMDLSEPGILGISGPARLEITATSTTNWTAESNVTLTLKHKGQAPSQVEFIANGQVVGTVSQSPYVYNWESVAEGVYEVWVRATVGGTKLESRSTGIFLRNESQAASIQISPELVWLAPSEGAQFGKINNAEFSAEVFDQYFDRIENAPLEWNYTGNGQITPQGEFTSGNSQGTYTLTAKSGGLEENATIHVYDILRINFQPKDLPVPIGFIADKGKGFGPREFGLQFGWTPANEDNARSRGHFSALDPFYPYSTINHMDHSSTRYTWEVELPNGDYRVRVVTGDHGYTGDHKILAEGMVIAEGVTIEKIDEFIFGEQTLSVTDGRLTLTTEKPWDKIVFVDIYSPENSSVPALSSATSSLIPPNHFRKGQIKKPILNKQLKPVFGLPEAFRDAKGALQK